MLPVIFDRLRKVALVVSPLIALMEDQTASIKPLGITVARISEILRTLPLKRRVKNNFWRIITDNIIVWHLWRFINPPLRMRGGLQ